MKNIIVLGSSVSGAKAAEEIRREDQESKITIVCTDGRLPYMRHLFDEFISKSIEEDKLYYRTAEYYQQNRIDIIADKKIVKINFKKRYVETEEKERFEYDILIATDTPGIRFPDIKGNTKKGIFSLQKLSDIQDLMSVLPILDTVVIEADSIKGLHIARAIKSRKKEVLLVTGGEYILSAILEKEPAEMIAKLLEENGLRVVKNSSINEILGNGDVKAVRLESGKVFAVQAVILGATKPDLRLFNSSDLTMNSGVVVNEHFQSSLENVFALDHLCEMENQTRFNEDLPFSDLEEEGKIVGLNINGQQTTFHKSLKTVTFHMFDLSICLIGNTKQQTGCQISSQFNPDTKAYKSLFKKDQRIVGAVLINCESEKEKYFKLIEQKIDVSSLGGRVLDIDCTYEEIAQSTQNSLNQIENPAEPKPALETTTELNSQENIRIE